MTFPRSVDDLTADWLATQLQAEVTDFRTEQIGVGVGLLGHLYRIHLEGDGPRSVIAKFPVQDEITRTHVATPLGVYQSEVGFYRDLAAETPIETPFVHAAEVEDASGDFVLLLEDLAALRCEDQTAGCSPEDAALVLEHLATHHAHFALGFEPGRYPWLADITDTARHQVVAGMAGQAAGPFLETLGADLDADLREFVAGLPASIPTYLAGSKEPTVTLAHVDLRLDNIFFGGPDRPVVVLDWQLTSTAGVAYDVAYFLSQSMAAGDRRVHERRLVEGYLADMADRGCPIDPGAFWIDYRRTVAFCLLYPVNAVAQVDLANDRARELVDGMLARAVAAIRDHDALAVWPAG